MHRWSANDQLKCLGLKPIADQGIQTKIQLIQKKIKSFSMLSDWMQEKKSKYRGQSWHRIDYLKWYRNIHMRANYLPIVPLIKNMQWHSKAYEIFEFMFDFINQNWFRAHFPMNKDIQKIWEKFISSNFVIF